MCESGTHLQLREPELVDQAPPPLLATALAALVPSRLAHVGIAVLVALGGGGLDARLEARDEPGEEEDGLVDAHDVLERGGALLEALADAVEVGHALEEVVLCEEKRPESEAARPA